MVSSNYIGSSHDCHMNKEEYEAYEKFMKETFYCILCENPHTSKKGTVCQIDDCIDYPEEWENI